MTRKALLYGYPWTLRISGATYKSKVWPVNFGNCERVALN